ncbi:MAG: hypothetical protein MRY79_04275 [Alphaproteobacteria bacterium]|nr:hypothetical protein [Alphaproteobacteria bacterium]
MSFFDDLFKPISKSVGNNMENDPDDVIRTKKKFKTIGRYNDEINNGYIDRELDDAIWGFQRKEKLKPDGFMNPGGETERTLNKKVKEKEKERERKEEENIKMAGGGAGAAAATALGARLLPLAGITAMSMQKWIEDRHKNGAQNKNKELDNQGPDCDAIYESETKRCNETTNTRGKRAGAICHASASNRYGNCRAGKPEDQWGPLRD